MSENDLVKATLQYLNAIGHFAYRTHNYPIWDEKLKMYRRQKNSIKGLPDIHVCLKGGLFATVETKHGKGKQTPEQKQFQDIVEKLGGKYVLAYNIDQVMKAFPNKGYSGSIGI